MADNDSSYSSALDIVNRYYQRVVELMAVEICDREDSILEGGFGWTEIEDRYANKFFNISQIYCNLKKFTASEEEEEETAPPLPIHGIEASRLAVEERVCGAEQTRETIEQWLEENPDAVIWKIQVHPLNDGQTNCLFLYTT